MKHISVFAVFLILVAAFAAACTQAVPSDVARVQPAMPNPTPAATAAQPPSDEVFDGRTVDKSNEEWKKELKPAVYNILREAGTERPYSGKYATNHDEGDYYCAACHLKLFSSKAKFESGTGWPSFYEPVNKKNVVEEEDRSLGDVRTEVLCARCRSHLGHVFDDGPKPTGLRYCMNSLALKFEKKS